MKKYYVLTNFVTQIINEVEAENEEERNHYLFIRNKVTVLVTEALCEVPYVYTLKNDDGRFAVTTIIKL